MSAEYSEPVGDLAEVNQEDAEPLMPMTAVAVTVDGPVQVHELPSVSGGMRSFTLAAADQAKKICGADRRRRSVRIWSSVAYTIGTSQNEATTGYGAVALANMTIVITHCEELWVKMAADGVLSVIVENWAS